MEFALKSAVTSSLFGASVSSSHRPWLSHVVGWQIAVALGDQLGDGFQKLPTRDPRTAANGNSTLLVRPIQCHLPWAGKQSEALLEGAEHGVAATSAAGGGSDAVTERRENCGRIPPLLRIIVYYQYFMINVCRYISPNTSPPNPELGPFCGNGCCRLIDILLHCC